MPKNRTASHDIDAYEHAGKTRLNNPPAGLVTQETDPDLSPKTYSYDPHLDPQLVCAFGQDCLLAGAVLSGRTASPVDHRPQHDQSVLRFRKHLGSG